MLNWLKQNAVALLVVLCGAVGVYAGTEVKIASALERAENIEKRLDAVEPLVREIPLLRQEVGRSAKSIDKFEKVTKDFTQTMHKLDITLTEMNGNMKVLQKDIDLLKERTEE